MLLVRCLGGLLVLLVFLELSVVRGREKVRFLKRMAYTGVELARCGEEYSDTTIVIISMKPVRQQLFMRLGKVGRLYGALSFWARRARFSVFLPLKAVGHISSYWFWVVGVHAWRWFLRCMKAQMRDVRFGWVVEINVRGNAYLWRRWRIRKLRRAALLVRAGFFYNLLVVLPMTLRLFWHKSYVRLFTVNAGDLAAIAEYIRFTRNLFPYKLAGFIFEEERFILKPGKKGKNK